LKVSAHVKIATQCLENFGGANSLLLVALLVLSVAYAFVKPISLEDYHKAE